MRAVLGQPLLRVVLEWAQLWEIVILLVLLYQVKKSISIYVFYVWRSEEGFTTQVQ